MDSLGGSDSVKLIVGEPLAELAKKKRTSCTCRSGFPARLIFNLWLYNTAI
jgi:hypothetical protein